MHIILVSDGMATARSITLTRRHLIMAATGLLMTVLVLSSTFSYLTVRHAAELRLPFLQDLLRSISLEETGKTREMVRENLANMAARLGQMQAQLMQLDSLGERMAAMAGVKLKDSKPAAFTAPPAPAKVDKPAKAEEAGRGGPLLRPDNLTTTEMQQALDELARQVEQRSDALATLENRMLEERFRKNLVPSAPPVATDSRGSGFGWRNDPFTGLNAMHEGIDFIAEPGSPILAAAAGIVKTVERHPQYGNMIEIDHGNDLLTRYAHASQIFAKPGEFVKRGQRIAAVGSTGRSTGPHLHFEVRIGGVAQNPARFLDAANARQLARK